MKLIQRHLVILILSVSGMAWAQLDLGQREDFLEVVAPIITRGERQIYEKLPDHDARKYFKSVFWYKRDPEPETAANAFRRTFYERRRLALERFGEEGTPGSRTERGKVFLLLGEPDEVNQQRLANSGLRTGYEEIWKYGRYNNLALRFVFDGRTPHYKLDRAEEWEAQFERIRNSQVLDRAEPFVQRPVPLTLPNLGFTKDIENLASEDKYDLDCEISYYFFRGDLNRTEVMVAITLKDASKRGMELHLAAYDPYTNKTREIKKLIEPENGRMEFLFLPLEPDQYDMILRLQDRDGREGTYRANIDVPRFSTTPVASSLLLADHMQQVPLFGFSRPKKFVYDTHFFPVEHIFEGFSSGRLYLMQVFYNFNNKPELRYYLDHQEVPARAEFFQQDEDGMRLVVSIPVQGATKGSHSIKSVYRNTSGDLVVHATDWRIDGKQKEGDLIAAATEGEAFRIIHPASSDITDMDRIAVRFDADLTPRRLYIYLNGNLIMERDKAPWEVYIDVDRLSTSGDNLIVAVLDTDQGLLKATKRFTPLRVDQKIQTRVVQIFFNAFNEDLQFINDLALDDLKVTVDNQPYKPLEVEKLEEPITYCFVVDTSYSMKDSFAANISAVKKFIESMRPQDKGFFVSINNNYSQILEPNQSKAVLLAVAESLQLQRLNPRFGNTLHEENTTYIYDGVIASIHTLLQYTGRTVIVLVSDGIGIEGIYSRNGMLAYARENNVVIYSLWLDNNPKLSDDETRFLQREKTGGEKFARKIGLSRFFAKKDAKLTRIGNKVRHASIAEGLLKIMAEESGGFHYRIFRADRTLIRDYVEDIEEAVASQYVMALNLPVSMHDYEIKITSPDDKIQFRNKSKVKVRDSNPLID